MDLDTLRQRMPEYAQTLGKMFADNALVLMQNAGQTLDDVTPAVTLTIKPEDGSSPIRITLSMDTGEEETVIPASEDKDAGFSNLHSPAASHL